MEINSKDSVIISISEKEKESNKFQITYANNLQSIQASHNTSL